MKSALSLVSIAFLAAGCDVVDEQQGEDQAALEGPAQESTPAVSGGLTPAERAKLVADYLADHPAPAGVGDPCSPIGSVCAPPVDAVIRDCSGFSGVCDSTATKDVILINFLCLPSGSGNICTAVAVGNPRTVDCTVPSNGRPCSTGCGPDFCAPYFNDCVQSTSRVRDCRSNGVCSNDSCINETVTRQTVGTCSRETDGLSCAHNPLCETGTFPLCFQGVCRCLLGIP